MKYQFCDCSDNKNQSCIEETTINSYPIQKFYIGCYLINALRQSTLECFYNQSCLLNIHNSTNILLLNSTILSRYSINTTILKILFPIVIKFIRYLS